MPHAYDVDLLCLGSGPAGQRAAIQATKVDCRVAVIERRRLLGVHAIGTGATELIHIGQAVLTLGGGLNYFLQTVFNYPTLAECY